MRFFTLVLSLTVLTACGSNEGKKKGFEYKRTQKEAPKVVVETEKHSGLIQHRDWSNDFIKY